MRNTDLEHEAVVGGAKGLGVIDPEYLNKEERENALPVLFQSKKNKKAKLLHGKSMLNKILVI